MASASTISHQRAMSAGQPVEGARVAGAGQCLMAGELDPAGLLRTVQQMTCRSMVQHGSQLAHCRLRHTLEQRCSSQAGTGIVLRGLAYLQRRGLCFRVSLSGGRRVPQRQFCMPEPEACTDLFDVILRCQCKAQRRSRLCHRPRRVALPQRQRIQTGKACGLKGPVAVWPDSIPGMRPGLAKTATSRPGTAPSSRGS